MTLALHLKLYGPLSSFFIPVIPTLFRAIFNDFPAKPLTHQFRLGNKLLAILVFYSPPPILDIYSFYVGVPLPYFLPRGTVNSNRITCFVELENRTISGRKEDITMCSGNLKRHPRSTMSCQSWGKYTSSGSLTCWFLFFPYSNKLNYFFLWVKFRIPDGCVEYFRYFP